MTSRQTEWQSANGKVILFGEHAVVYGVEAVAAAIPNMVRARASTCNGPARVSIRQWDVDITLSDTDSDNLLAQICRTIATGLGMDIKAWYVDIDAHVPPASGLGASAAVAVAIIKALAALHKKPLSLSEVNEMAYQCELLAHGTPSGLDNTLATYGGVLRFKREAERMRFSKLEVSRSFELLIALTGKKGYTAQTVARVRLARAQAPEKFAQLFSQIGSISLEGIEALAANDLEKLAVLFKRNQQCLREIDVSCKEIEQVLTIAEANGSKGGKLTGSGDGGAVILLPGKALGEVEAALNAAGFDTLRACFDSSETSV